MLDILKKNKIILVIVGLLIAGFVWYGMSGGTDTPALLESSAVNGDPAVAAQERQLLDTLFQLRAIQLAGTIFTNPAFQALRDFRTEIVSEPIGRKNPFAPLSQGANEEESQ